MSQMSMRELWLARVTVIQMMEDLLHGRHMDLSEPEEQGHPFFVLIRDGRPTDHMPVTHEQHKALIVLRDQFKKGQDETNSDRD